MFNFLKVYHYVPPCPHCNSIKTGRYIYVANATFNIEKIMANNLKKGELSRTVYGFSDFDSPTAYCSECGCEWKADIVELPLTKKRVEKELKDRGITNEKIQNMVNVKENVRLQQRKMKQEKRKRKKEEKKRLKEATKKIKTNRKDK